MAEPSAKGLAALWGHYLSFLHGLSRSSRALLAAYSVLGGGTALLGAHVVRTKWFYSGHYQDNYFAPLGPADLFWLPLLCAAVALLTTIALFALRGLWERIPVRDTPANARKVFLVSWLVIFACWMPYFLANFPASLYADSIVTIRQALGQNTLSTHHPLAYTGFVALCLKAGNATFGSNIAGIAIYTLSQMLAVSGILAYFCAWLARRRIPLPAIVVLVALFAMWSVFSLHAVSMWKDALYAAFMLLLALAIFDLVAANGKLATSARFLVRIGVIGLLVALSRTNGIYVMLATWAVLAIYRFNWKLLATAALSLGVFFGSHAIVTHVVDTRTEPVESYGIVLQQASAVVVYDGSMTPEQEQFMDTLLPLGQYKEAYKPNSVDGVKWADDFDTEFFDTHQSEFLSVWAQMALANPGIYAKAFILESYEYWSFGDLYRALHVNYVNDKYDAQDLGIEETNLIERHLGQWAASLFPFKFVSLGEGVTSWLLLFGGLLLAIARRSKWSAKLEKPWNLVLLPALFSWGTVLLSSPFAALPRYVLPTTFLLPLVFLFLWAADGATS